MKSNEPSPHTACLLGMKVERTQAVVISYHPFFPDTSELIHLLRSSFSSFLASGICWQFLVLPWLVHRWLQSLPPFLQDPPLCVSVPQISFSFLLKGHQLLGLGPILNPGWPNLKILNYVYKGLPWWLSGKESPANALIPDPRRSHLPWSN